MIYLAFILVLLIIFDHLIKDKRHGLLYYKNDHTFSIVIAITSQHLTLEQHIKLARKSKHECIFVNINKAINKDDYKDLTIIDLAIDVNEYEDMGRMKYLAQAYHEGMKHTSHDFLLFIDDQVYFEPIKTVSHLANNLVEHQLFTGKEVLEKRKFRQGYLLFLDLFRDMNYPKGTINYSFYAIKKETYLLASGDKVIPDSVAAFETMIERKNITIHHIAHGKTLHRKVLDLPFKLNLKHYFLQMRVLERLLGAKRLLLYMLALHIFYIAFFIDFHLINFVLLAVVHMGVFLSVKNYVKHHPASYIFMPLYLLLFDFIYVFGLIKRRNYQKQKIRKGDHNAKTDTEFKEKSE